jgi:DNA (cytosine-5)-methyltransferase 1
VPGVLSSNKGRDFGAFLGAVAELGYGFSYRVLDAQYFGVAQRRRRVFVVGHLGDWRPTAKVLFESESLQRNIGKGKEKKQNTSNCSSDGLVGTLLARDYKGIGSYDYDKIITQSISSFWNGSQTAETLTRTSDDQRMPDKNRFQAVLQPIAFDAYNSSVTGNVTKTLDTGSDYHHVPVACIGGQHPNAAIGEEISPTLTNAMGAGGGHVPVIGNMAVRRLTEVECERLQGFPDNYTNIRENCPSGARYKALGNSMAVPVMRWIGERINNYERL